MKPGITFKLFFAILGCCVALVLAMAVAAGYSFGQGFLGYLNEQEEQRIASLRPLLANAYREHGSWDFLRDQPRTWFNLLVPGADQATWDGPSHRSKDPGDADFIGVNLRVSLLDAGRRLVIGSPRLGPAASFKSIETGGKVVGWIGMVPFQDVTEGAGQRFQQQQLKTGIWIGAVAIALAALVAWLLARMVLAPVRRIAASTHQLAAGDYGARVAHSSQDELGALAQDFNQLALTLEKNEGLRRAFMADISHELRTPLAVLRGEMEAIEDGIRPMTPAALASLQTEVQALGKLVDDLYELSLSDAGALSYRKRRTDVIAVLGEALGACEKRYAERGIVPELRSEPGQRAICDADPDRLRQLFLNLFENTARYTDIGGRLVLSVRSDGPLLHIELHDSAPGVAPDKLAQVFERFFRIDPSRSRSSGGSGLGLAICRNIVEAHQGRITAAASPLGGLWISVTLPLAAGDQA